MSFYVIDVMMLAGKDLCGEPLGKRRDVLAEVMTALKDPVRESSIFDANLSDIVASVMAEGA